MNAEQFAKGPVWILPYRAGLTLLDRGLAAAAHILRRRAAHGRHEHICHASIMVDPMAA
jgi:hypothetical protein